MKPLKVILLSLLLVACSQTVVNYPSVCKSDETCKRNQNAKTLNQLGHDQAALKLICQDDSVRSVLDKCDGSGHSGGLQQQQ